VIMIILCNIIPTTNNINKSDTVAMYSSFAALLFMLSPKLFRHRPRSGAPDVMRADLRAPVLFLRSFEDEGIAVSSSNFWSFDTGNRVSFFLMVLLRQWLGSIGPVVAIADPANPDPPMADASRAEVTEDKWREVAAEWITSAAMIVMIGGRTKGVQWELSHIVANGHLDKLLMFLPPPQDERNISAAERWQNILACFKGSPLFDELSKVDAELLRAIAFTRNGRAVAFLSQTAVATDYELAGFLGIMALIGPPPQPASCG
jgi:hypothetical protein